MKTTSAPSLDLVYQVNTLTDTTFQNHLLGWGQLEAKVIFCSPLHPEDLPKSLQHGWGSSECLLGELVNITYSYVHYILLTTFNLP